MSGAALRLFDAGDAPGVAACARAVYGSDYACGEIYDPEAIRRRNAEGAWISIVAVDDRDHVVAHLALVRSAYGPVAETGMGMVLPDHRRHGVLPRLRDRAVDEAARAGLSGYWFEVGTENRAIQAMANAAPVHPCGITLGLWPGADPAARRQSFIRYFRFVRPPARAVVHALSRHEEILARIYAELHVPVEFDQAGAPDRAGEVVVDRYPRVQAAFVTVTGVGPGTCAEIEAAIRSIQEDPAIETAYLELPLAQAGAAAACASAESLGFFFAGLAPFGARDGDALRLQWRRRPEPVACDTIAHPFARALCDHVARAEAEAR